jgi:transcriptional regulator with XRE-family HTH domain
MNMKKEPEKTLLDKYLEDPEFARLMAQGDLIMEVTETLCELLQKEHVSRKELAERLGKTKGFVSQLLNGGRNLTLRTVADILHVLGYKVTLTSYKEEEKGQKSNIIELQTLYIPPKKPTENWEKLEVSRADIYFEKEVILGRGVL